MVSLVCTFVYRARFHVFLPYLQEELFDARGKCYSRHRVKIRLLFIKCPAELDYTKIVLGRTVEMVNVT